MNQNISEQLTVGEEVFQKKKKTIKIMTTLVIMIIIIIREAETKYL